MGRPIDCNEQQHQTAGPLHCSAAIACGNVASPTHERLFGTALPAARLSRSPHLCFSQGPPREGCARARRGRARVGLKRHELRLPQGARCGRLATLARPGELGLALPRQHRPATGGLHRPSHLLPRSRCISVTFTWPKQNDSVMLTLNPPLHCPRPHRRRVWPQRLLRRRRGGRGDRREGRRLCPPGHGLHRRDPRAVRCRRSALNERDETGRASTRHHLAAQRSNVPVALLPSCAFLIHTSFPQPER